MSFPICRDLCGEIEGGRTGTRPHARYTMPVYLVALSGEAAQGPATQLEQIQL